MTKVEKDKLFSLMNSSIKAKIRQEKANLEKNKLDKALQKACKHPYIGSQWRPSLSSGYDCNGGSNYNPGHLICLVCGLQHFNEYDAGPLYNLHYKNEVIRDKDINNLWKIVGSKLIKSMILQDIPATEVKYLLGK